MTNLNSLFTFGADRRLDLDEEIALIAAAQGGDETAKETLLGTYGAALRKAVSRFSRDGAIDVEDAQATALLAFVEVLDQHDASKGDRLAGRLVQRVTAALAEATSTTTAFAIPERTLSRFYGILRAADGDVATARKDAHARGMTVEVFDDVLRALRDTSSMTDVLRGEDSDDEGDRLLASPIASGVESSYDEVEDRLLVEVAFEAVDDEEARICELFYGFTEYEPVPDGEIAHRLGLSRPKVQRRRVGALDKMRKATGVLPEDA